LEHDITEDMIPRDIAPDSIKQEGEWLVGKVDYYIFSAGELKMKKVEFYVRIGISLTSFNYKKPVIGAAGVLNPIGEQEEENPREGYVPLAIVRNAYRGPHHWHRRDDGMFCAVRKTGNDWETRYFPRQNIPEKTWREACEMLGKNPG
jgi:hypothetical protein